MEMGFTAIGYDPVMPMGDPRQLSLEELSNAELVTKNIREAVGDKVDLLIKTHGQMTTSSAIRLAKRLEKYDPLWFEEPVPPENVDEIIALIALYRPGPMEWIPDYLKGKEDPSVIKFPHPLLDAASPCFLKSPHFGQKPVLM